ncbi:MAG: hypothetical protein ACYS26_05430 [Planctomycetota bacterium]
MIKSNPGLITKTLLPTSVLMLIPLLANSRSVKYLVPDHKDTLLSFWKRSIKYLGSSVISIKEYDIDLNKLTPEIVGEMSSSTIDIITARVILDLLSKDILTKVKVRSDKVRKAISYLVKDITNLKQVDDSAIDAYLESLRDGSNTFSYNGIQYNTYLEDSPIQIAKAELSDKASDHKKVGEMIDELEKLLK